MRQHQHNCGFTLIEVMIALFVFSIVATILSVTLRNVIQQQRSLRTHSAMLADFDIAMNMMQRDITQMIYRPILTADKQTQPALIGQHNSISFTRCSVHNPLSMEKRSDCQRIHYEVQNGTLFRFFSTELDRTIKTKVIKQPLLHGITHFDIFYYTTKQQALREWPTHSMLTAFEQKKPLPSLPIAVQVNLAHKKLGTVQQLYLIRGEHA